MKPLTEEYLDTLSLQELSLEVDRLNEGSCSSSKADRELHTKKLRQHYLENFEIAQEALNDMVELEESSKKL